MAVVDDALGSWRTKRSSRLENAGILQQAVALLRLLALCGKGPSQQGDALLHEQLSVSAQARYCALTRKVGGGRISGDGRGMSPKSPDLGLRLRDRKRNLCCTDCTDCSPPGLVSSQSVPPTCVEFSSVPLITRWPASVGVDAKLMRFSREHKAWKFLWA